MRIDHPANPKAEGKHPNSHLPHDCPSPFFKWSVTGKLNPKCLPRYSGVKKYDSIRNFRNLDGESQEGGMARDCAIREIRQIGSILSRNESNINTF
jgi:hypothetical protein